MARPKAPERRSSAADCAAARASGVRTTTRAARSTPPSAASGGKKALRVEVIQATGSQHSWASRTSPKAAVSEAREFWAEISTSRPEREARSHEGALAIERAPRRRALALFILLVAFVLLILLAR